MPLDLSKLLTPPELQDGPEPTVIEIIDTARYPNFNSLLVQRDRIRRLELLPAKTQADHERYHKLRDSGILLSQLQEQLKVYEIFVIPNKFPYDIPRDVVQLIIWFLPTVSREVIHQAIELELLKRDLEPRDAISFERIVKTNRQFIRSSFPHVGHLHLWLPRIT